MPKLSKEASRYWRCAHQRLDEAKVLLNAGYTTGAVYLTGYSVEFLLKTLLLMAVPSRVHVEMVKSFRGAKAHDFEWLLNCYREQGGARFPPEIARKFTLVNRWSTDLRFEPKQEKRSYAEAFINAVEAILHCASRRL